MPRLLVPVVLAVVVGMAALFESDGWRRLPDRAHAATPLFGDLTCDGQVTTADVLAGVQALAGTGTAPCLPAAGDVNCSGATDMADLTALMRHLSGLPVVVPPGCPAIGSPVEAGPSAHERIEAARARGELTTGQALLFHLYADLGDDRLPAAYRGSTDGPVESAIFEMVAAAWPALSAAERDALRPFLLPPAAPGSWVEQGDVGLLAIQWETVSNAKVRVWWQTRRPEDAAKAAAILAEMESFIWPELVDYMGREPLSDAGWPYSGGDGRYDIYLVHVAPDAPGEEPVLGYVSAHVDAQGNAACELTPSYMVLNSREPPSPELLSTVAHEFMHSLQFAYDLGSCDDYRWLRESTATWVESWLYPDVNVEHGFASKYLEALQEPLEKFVYKDPRQYGSYLFWYFLQHEKGMYAAVHDVWAESHRPDSLQAIQAAVAAGGGLEQLWPESALYNWNRPPYDDFTGRDGLLAFAPFKDTAVNTTSASVSYAVPTALGHMRQDHLHYTIGAGVKSLTFINPFPGSGEEHAKVQALVNIDGTWETVARDWTDTERVRFCLDRPGERVRALVIIITNANYFDRTHTFDVGDGELVASPLGCTGWVGTAEARVVYYDTTFTITATGLRFAPQPDMPGDERYSYYDLVEIGSATWEVSGTWPGGCTASGSMTLTQPGTPGGAAGDITIDHDENDYFIYGVGGPPGSTFTITCPEGGSWQQPWPVIPWIWNGGGTDTPLKDEGGTFVLDAEWHEPTPAYGGTWRWRLTEVE